jgi:hypothetical protein
MMILWTRTKYETFLYEGIDVPYKLQVLVFRSVQLRIDQHVLYQHLTIKRKMTTIDLAQIATSEYRLKICFFGPNPASTYITGIRSTEYRYLYYVLPGEQVVRGVRRIRMAVVPACGSTICTWRS